MPQLLVMARTESPEACLQKFGNTCLKNILFTNTQILDGDADLSPNADIVVNASGNTYVCNLPPVGQVIDGARAMKGKLYVAIQIGLGGKIRLTAVPGETVSGSATFDVRTKWRATVFVAVGVIDGDKGWVVISSD